MFKKRMLPRGHAAAGGFAFVTIFVFLASSVFVEARGDFAAIAAVKRAIAWGLLLLVPALIATGASGFVMVAGRPAGLALAKFRRMRVVAANGLFLLVPAALYLSWKAEAGAFDRGFMLVQMVEFAAGSTNLVLIGLNIRDGLLMSRQRKSHSLTPRHT